MLSIAIITTVTIAAYHRRERVSIPMNGIITVSLTAQNNNFLTSSFS